MINALLEVMNRFLRHIFLLVVVVFTTATAYAQEDTKLLLGVNFETFFDNTEYSQNQMGWSGTVFSARLSPKIGVEWNEKNALVIGADLFADFGDEIGKIGIVQNSKTLNSRSRKGFIAVLNNTLRDMDRFKGGAAAEEIERNFR